MSISLIIAPYIISLVMVILMLVTEVMLWNRGIKNYTPRTIAVCKAVRYMAFTVVIIITLWQIFTLM